MTELHPEAAAILRAVAEIFVPGIASSDPTPGAADVEADRFVSHYLDFLVPGLEMGLPALLDGLAAQRYARTFLELTLDERTAVVESLEEHPIEPVRELPVLLGVLAVAAVYGEWTGQDAEGALIRRPLGWELTGFDGPSRGRPHLLHAPI